MEPPSNASERAVSFSFLQQFIKQVPTEYTTGDVVFKIIVPATKQQKCHYTKLIRSRDSSKPNYFVSHRWGCKFHFIFERLQNFMKLHPDLKEATTFFWVDIFAVNQHPGQEQQADLSQLVAAVSLSSKTLLCMDETGISGLDSLTAVGLVLTRIWCLYEIWKTLSLKKDDASHLLILMNDLDTRQVGEILRRFHVEKAQATIESDRITILNDIQSHIGTQEMTMQVKDAMLKSSQIEAESMNNSSNFETQQKALLNCSYLHQLTGKYSIAEKYAKKALAVATKRHGEQHQDVAICMNNLAEVLSKQGKYEEAEKSHLKALVLQKKLHGEEHRDVAASKNNLAEVLTHQAHYQEAELLHQEALKVQRKLLGNQHPDVAQSMNNLAQVFFKQGKFEEAEKLHRETLNLRKKLFGTEHPDIAQSMNNLAAVLSAQRNYKEAEELYRATLRLEQKLLGDQHPDVAACMNNLAEVLSGQEKYAEAEKTHRQALTLFQVLLGNEHPSVAASMNNLALVLSDQQKYAEAEKLHRQELALSKKLLGDKHPSVAASMNNLALVLSKQGKYVEAEQIHREELVISKKLLGDEHPDVATSKNNLAEVLSKQGKYEEAIMLAQGVLLFYERRFGSNSYQFIEQKQRLEFLKKRT